MSGSAAKSMGRGGDKERGRTIAMSGSPLLPFSPSPHHFRVESADSEINPIEKRESISGLFLKALNVSNGVD